MTGHDQVSINKVDLRGVTYFLLRNAKRDRRVLPVFEIRRRLPQGLAQRELEHLFRGVVTPTWIDVRGVWKGALISGRGRSSRTATTRQYIADHKLAHGALLFRQGARHRLGPALSRELDFGRRKS